ncbi:MAG: metal-dependent transcriptional regulator [Oscillospiraceae bacterium]|nr:metal-dependent transcriptional regulator [Oscillospiraceae bacterium]
MSKTETIENYLETIYMIKLKKGSVRSIDISVEMGYSKPTISVTVKRYREEGYITIDNDGYISLTEKGLEIAESTYERHNVIANILMALGVDEETAFNDSCKIEHCISEKSFQAMKAHFNQMKKK